MKNFKLLFESILLLTEDRIDYLKQQYKDKLPTDHDELAKHTDTDKIVDHFADKADPTSNKVHTQWLLNQYKSKNIRQEDAPQLKSTLQDFEKTKNSLEKKDLNQYNSVGELRDAVATQKAPVERAMKEKESAEARKGSDMPKLYDQDGVQGFKIPNKETSIKNYGPGGVMAKTNWCTAANSENNMFNHYKGGKYTMHFPNGEVLQFHHQSNQIKDKNDSEINEGDPRFKDYEHHIGNFIKQTKGDEKDSRIAKRFQTYTPEEVDAGIESWNNPNHYFGRSHTLHDIAKRAKLTDVQIEKIKNSHKSKNEYDSHPADHLLSNSNISIDKLEPLIKEAYKSPKSPTLLSNLSENSNLKGKYLDKLLKHHMEQVGTSEPLIKLAEKNSHLSESNINEILDKKSTLANTLAKNHGITLTKEHQDKIIDKTSKSEGTPQALYSMSERKDLHPESVDKLIDLNNLGVNVNLIDNHQANLSSDHIKKLIRNSNVPQVARLFNSDHENMKDNREAAFNNILRHTKEFPKESVFGMIANSKHLTKDHVNKMIEAGDNAPHSKGDIYRKISNHKKLDSGQISNLLDKPEASQYADSLLQNNRLKPEHLHKIMDNMLEENHHEDILNHPSTNTEVLHKLFDKGNTLTRNNILHHPKAQLSHFNKAMDMGTKMHGAISSSPSAPPSMLHDLADSPLSFVRSNVVKNKNTLPETHAKLINDSLPEIAALAKKKYKGK